MAKITDEQRDRYTKKSEDYKKNIQQAQSKEAQLLASCQNKPLVGQTILLAQTSLEVFSWQLLHNSLSVSLLGIKSDEILIEARKTLARSLRYLEMAVSNYLDHPFSEYESNLEALSFLGHVERYALVRKLGFAVQSLEEAFGEKSKYQASFLEFWGRVGVIAKNLVNFKTAVRESSMGSPLREVLLEHLATVKQLLQSSANRYRAHYELYTHKPQDFYRAIDFLQGLRRVHLYLNEHNEAETLAKKIEIWKNKLEQDIKNKR